jgi:hypothetical protein
MKLCRRYKLSIMQALKIDSAMLDLFVKLTNLDEDFIAAQIDKIQEESTKRFHGDPASYEGAADLVMDIIDYYLDNHGVEAINHESFWNGKYWRDTGAIYSNAGDTYGTTVLYDINKEEFLVTSWGDWYEQNVEQEEEA